MTIQQALDTPWKIYNEIERWACYPLVRILFMINRIPWGHNWRFYGLPIIQKHRQSAISIGPGLALRSSRSSNPGGPNHPIYIATLQKGARLNIGANFGMSGGAICLVEEINIGNNVYVGLNSTIVDSDFHPIDYQMRKIDPNHGNTRPVTIGDNVFIGMNCMILKGVEIGAGSVIGAYSLVTKKIPPHVIAVGNPARVVQWL